VGQALCYWILTSSGKVIARTTIQNLTHDKKRDDPKVLKNMQTFDDKIAA
jgi:hypothetical protein